MISLNARLESLNAFLSQLSILKSAFAAIDHSQLVQLARHLDVNQQGSLSPSCLAPPQCFSLEFQIYIKEHLSQRICPNTLVSHLLADPQVESFTHIRDNFRLEPQQIQQFLLLEFQIHSLRRQIIASIGEYVYSSNGFIERAEFQGYCHKQSLPLNCSLVFDSLARGEQEIETEQKYHKIRNEEIKMNQEGRQRVSEVLERLEQRVGNFGREWLSLDRI